MLLIFPHNNDHYLYHLKTISSPKAISENRIELCEYDIISHYKESTKKKIIERMTDYMGLHKESKLGAAVICGLHDSYSLEERLDLAITVYYIQASIKDLFKYFSN